MRQFYLLLSALPLLPIISHAFTSQVHPTLQVNPSSTLLHGTKRRGKLGNNIAVNEDGKISKIMTKKEKQKLGNSKMKRDKNDKAEISPLLAEWAKDGEGSDSVPGGGAASDSWVDTASTFTPFEDEDDATKGKKRRKPNSTPVTSLNSAKVDEILNSIEEMLSSPNCNIPNLLSEITTLIDLQTQAIPSLKSILSKKPAKDEKQSSYRLAWVGSDKAICHIGTALHKVPLARLQEIFLCLGYNRWELLEVIRILGPFPNVRNTLKGDVKVMKMGNKSGFSSGGAVPVNDGSGREAVRLNIAYNSMVDGTGKEILAGKETNVKYVDLDVWFASEKAVVCTIVDEFDEDANVDPLTGNNGEKVLLFVAEENLDESLEKLRAA